MSQTMLSVLFALGLLVGTTLCLRIGWHLGRRRFLALGEDAQAGLGAVEGAIFGLMGLMIAFTFTGAATRFDTRREIIVDQVNAISTAWLRLDMLQDTPREEIQELFRQLVDKLLLVPELANDRDAAVKEWALLAQLQDEIWAKAIYETKNDKSLPLAQTLLPPLNEMFDITQSRFLATRRHPPMAVYIVLGVLVLVSALMAGFGMSKAKRQSTVHVVGFAVILSMSIYLILDLEFPRLGLVRIDAYDQALVELRETMD